MAKQGSAPVTAPTFEPSKAIPLLEKLILNAEELRSESWTSPRRDEWTHTAEGLLLSAVGSGNPAMQNFSTAQCFSSGSSDTAATLALSMNEMLDRMLAVLRSVVQQLRWQLPDPTQVFLAAGSSHDAFVEIRKIIQLVKSEVLIVDTYVDETLWTLLTNIPSAAKVQIMTTQMKGDFRLEAKKFAAQHGNVVEVRTTPQYHDRFILVDGGRCWHLGASIKDAGNKAFAMSEILGPTIRSAIKSDVGNTWTAASVVPL